MALCKKCGCEFDQEEVTNTLESEYDGIMSIAGEIEGMCEDCANSYLDYLARVGRDYMNGD